MRKDDSADAIGRGHDRIANTRVADFTRAFLKLGE
jgi:hypothetical protein